MTTSVVAYHRRFRLQRRKQLLQGRTVPERHRLLELLSRPLRPCEASSRRQKLQHGFGHAAFADIKPLSHYRRNPDSEGVPEILRLLQQVQDY